MGLIHGRYSDAFISYARLDDDLTNKFVQQFERALSHWFSAYLSDPGSNGSSDVFIDTKHLPENGPLSVEIRRAVQSSMFLFVLVGQKYAESAWCLQELAWFLDRPDRALQLPRQLGDPEQRISSSS